jgi:hypothetical protein
MSQRLQLTEAPEAGIIPPGAPEMDGHLLPRNCASKGRCVCTFHRKGCSLLE